MPIHTSPIGSMGEWYIDLHEIPRIKSTIFVGKYATPMDPIGKNRDVNPIRTKYAHKKYPLAHIHQSMFFIFQQLPSLRFEVKKNTLP